MITQINRKTDCEYTLKLEHITFAKKMHVESKSRIGVQNDRGFWPEQWKSGRAIYRLEFGLNK